jgi:Ca2+-binding RTX toxin-like protein
MPTRSGTWTGQDNFDDSVTIEFDTSTGYATYDAGTAGFYGVDGVGFNNFQSGVVVDLNPLTGRASYTYSGTSTFVNLVNFEGVTGTNFTDTLTGNDVTNWFTPKQGNDIIDGKSGKDVVMFEDASRVIVNLGGINSSAPNFVSVSRIASILPVIVSPLFSNLKTSLYSFFD